MDNAPEEKERTYLKNIKVKGFKSIREMDLDLNPLNVIIGANGSGKSNFLSVFTMYHNISNNRFQSFVRKTGGANSIIHLGAGSDIVPIFEFDFDIFKYYCKLTYGTGDDLYIEYEILHPKHQSKDDSTLNLLGGELESILSLLADQEESSEILREVFDMDKIAIVEDFAKSLLSVFQESRVYHFLDTSVTAKIKQSCNVHDNKYLRPDSSNISAFLYLLKRKYLKNYRNIVETVQMVTPFFGDFDLEPTPDNENYIMLEWHHKESDDYYNADQLSDGTLRFICLATLLLQPNLPPLILIDEPELGLHPHAISVLAGLLKSISSKTQIIVATQSVTLVNQLSYDDVIIVDRVNEESVFSRPEREKVETWIKEFEEYGMGDLWEKNIIGGNP